MGDSDNHHLTLEVKGWQNSFWWKMLLCLWERLVSAVIIWSCWVCTLAQCLCILGTIYHCVLRIGRNKSTKKKNNWAQHTYFLSMWMHSDCGFLYLFMNSFCLYSPYLCISITEECRGGYSGSSPDSLLLTVPKALSTNTGYKSISMSALTARNSLQEDSRFEERASSHWAESSWYNYEKMILLGVVKALN